MRKVQRAPAPVGLSTAPWDQPRNATTTTLYFPAAETADEAAIIEQLHKERPWMRGIEVEIIHARKPAYDDLRGPSVCCLISWDNTATCESKAQSLEADTNSAATAHKAGHG